MLYRADSHYKYDPKKKKWVEVKTFNPARDGKKDRPASGWKAKFKADGGKISKYYKGGGTVITGRD